MYKYVCTYLNESGSKARRAYWAEWLDQAMACHNAAMPEFAARVVKWNSPEGLTFHHHDVNASL